MTLDQFYQRSIRELKLAGIETSDLDVKVLMKFVLKKDEVFLMLEPKMPLTNYQQNKLNKLIERRKKGEPIAYLTHHKEFFGYDFFINKNVLIPRPESEELVSLALQRIKNTELRIQNGTNPKILDIGTGSGCIIISLAKELESLSALSFKHSANLFASDISSKALTVAKKNAKSLLCHSEHGEESACSKIKFYHSDLFSNRLLHKKYDIIIANLPYVPKIVESLKLKVESISGTDFEPQDAIFADDNGAAIIKKFLAEAKNYLAEDFLILIELDPRNAQNITKYAKTIYINLKIELSKDLAGLDRYLIITNQNNL